MSCPWCPPLETAPGLTGAGGAWQSKLCWLALTLSGRHTWASTAPKRITAPALAKVHPGHTHAFGEPIARVDWQGWPRLAFPDLCAAQPKPATPPLRRARLMSVSRPYGACCKAISSKLGHERSLPPFAFLAAPATARPRRPKEGAATPAMARPLGIDLEVLARD